MHLILAFDVLSSIEARIFQGYKAYIKVQLALFEIYEVFAYICLQVFSANILVLAQLDVEFKLWPAV